MKKYFYLFLVILCVACDKTLQTTTSLDVQFQSSTWSVASKDIVCKWNLVIKQTFEVANYNKDTFCLYMGKTNNFFANYLEEWTHLDHSKPYDKDMETFAKNFKLIINGIDYSKSCVYENSTLAFSLPKRKKHNIEIQYLMTSYCWILPFIYNYVPTSIYAQDLYSCDDVAKYEQWYFSTDNMEWKKVTIHSPNDNTTILANYPLKKEGNDYIFDFKLAKKEDGLWFSVFEENLYTKNQYRINNTTFNFYSQKYFDVDSVGNLTDIHAEPDSIITKDLQATQAICENIVHLFDDTIHRTLNIFQGDFGNGRCSGFISKNHNYVILLDTSRFDEDYYAQKWHHEFIHCFLSYPNDDDKKTLYLFTEGMVVYLDYCLYHRNDSISELDKHFERNYASLSEEVKNTPIFYLDRSADYQVIYTKSAYIIYQLTKRIGVEKFNTILKNYYAVLNANGDYVTLDGFEEFLKTNGVFNEDWEYFISLLS